MADEVPRLTLGFVGDAETHRANSLALLRDLVGGFLKQHRKAEVEVEFVMDMSSDTRDDIADWAHTSGYEVGYTEKVEHLLEDLSKADNARLIIVGDPGEDDYLYDVVVKAAEHKLVARSLLNGLERVVFDDDLDDEDLEDGFHEVDLDDDDLDDDLTGSDLDGDDAPDLDILATLADDGEVEAQEEIRNIAALLDIDVTPFETWTDAVAAIRGVKDDDENTVEVAPDYVPDPPQPPFPILKGEDLEDALDEDLPDDIHPVREYTREWLMAQDFDTVKAIGLEHGIAQGRGMKKPNYINKILVLTGAETAADQAKRKKPKAQEEATITPIREADPEATTTRSETIAQAAELLRMAADKLDTLI